MTNRFAHPVPDENRRRNPVERRATPTVPVHKHLEHVLRLGHRGYGNRETRALDQIFAFVVGSVQV